MSVGVGVWNQLPASDLESKSAKIQNFLFPYVSVGGGSGINYQLLVLSLNLLKSKMSYIREGIWNELPTFDQESKSAKIQNSLSGGSGTNFQLLILSQIC